VAREVAASTSEQNGVDQSLAEIVVDEKNRCIRMSVPDATGHRTAGES
jgi:hypothetical protein